MSAVNPPVSVVRKFVHLLDVGDNDYAEEFGTVIEMSLSLSVTEMISLLCPILLYYSTKYI